MEKEKFEKIIAKCVNGTASAEEQALVANYLDTFQQGNESWDSGEMGDKDLIGEQLYQRTQDEITAREEKNRVFKLRWLSAAAIFVALLSGGYFALRNNKPELTAQKFKNDVLPGSTKATLTLADGRQITLDEEKEGALTREGNVVVRKTRDGQLIYDMSGVAGSSKGKSQTAYNIISTPSGGKYMLILEDGTKVWMNSASSLKFPVAFTGDTRNVELTGEAYFEVARNRNKPFFVKGRGLDIKVLGTSFNLNSYASEPAAIATLIEGSVEVSGAGKKVLLKPGNQAGVSGSGISLVPHADLEEATAWKNGYFQFRDARLSEIMRQLARWYDVTVEYDRNLPDEEYTGVISQSVKISKVLEMLEQGGGVEFRIDGRKITVLSTEK